MCVGCGMRMMGEANSGTPSCTHSAKGKSDELVRGNGAHRLQCRRVAAINGVVHPLRWLEVTRVQGTGMLRCTATMAR